MLVVGVGKSWSDKQISLLANYPGEKLINQNYFNLATKSNSKHEWCTENILTEIETDRQQ